MHEYWTSFARSERGIVHENEHLTWSYTGGPYLNRVTEIRLTEDNAEQHIEAVHEQFRRWGAAVTWLVTPSAEPADIAQRLTTHGCALQEQWMGMAAEPSNIDFSSLESTPLTITDLEFHDGLDLWSSLVGDVYQLPVPARDTMRQLFADESPTVRESWRHFLAYEGDTPVATATLFLGSEAAGIYLVSTRPEHQRRGFGRTLTAYAAQQASAMGYDMIVLQATDEGQRLYERLGFSGVHRIDAFRWQPSSLTQRLRRFVLNRFA